MQYIHYVYKYYFAHWSRCCHWFDWFYFTLSWYFHRIFSTDLVWNDAFKKMHHDIRLWTETQSRPRDSIGNKKQNSPSIRPFVFVCGCVFSVFCRCCCCFCLSFHPVPLTLPLRLQGRWLVTIHDWSSTTLKLGLWPSAALFPASHPASSATCRALGTLHPGKLIILHCL